MNIPTPWETMLDKIKNKLNQWSRTGPTLYRRRLVAQAVIGGHTQFLTKVQGMPPHIEEALMKILRDFIWDHDIHPRVALEYLYLPLNKGGLNLLDINTRNEAIKVMWVKAYLDLTPSCPSWAVITDILINASAPPGTSAIATVNTFLQTWETPSRGPRLAWLGTDIIRMLKIAKKYKTNLGALQMTTRLKSLWCASPSRHHFGTA